MLGKYNILIVLVIALFLISGISAIIGGVIYFQKNSEPTLPIVQPLQSIIPTRQSGITEFNIPLPITGWELPVTVLCALANLTNAGIIQNTPVELTVNFTLQNFAAIGAVANDYIYIGSFNVEPVDAIEVSYSPNWTSPTFTPWSYQPSDPARFSSLWCTPSHSSAAVNMSNPSYDTFSNSGEIILQDTGLLNLKIEPIIFEKNPVDPAWQESNLTYYNFKPTVSIPISIMSELEANQQNNQIQQQNLQNNFQKLQAQQTINQSTAERQGESLALWVLAFASLDIGIALYDHSEDEEKKAEHEQRKAEKNHGKIADCDMGIV